MTIQMGELHSSSYELFKWVSAHPITIVICGITSQVHFAGIFEFVFASSVIGMFDSRGSKVTYEQRLFKTSGWTCFYELPSPSSLLGPHHTFNKFLSSTARCLFSQEVFPSSNEWTRSTWTFGSRAKRRNT